MSAVISSLKTYTKFSNGIMQTALSGNDRRVAYDLFREAVLDGQIPLNKAIGFKLFSSQHMEDIAVVDRHTSCLENMVELSKNVSRVVFVTPTGFAVSSSERTGNVTAGNARFMSDGKEIKVLDSNAYLFNSTEPLGIRIFAFESTGYHLMEENAETMRSIYSSGRDENATFFPLNSEHTLLPYLSVLPYLNGGDIKYRLRQGMTDEDLTVLWKRYLEGRDK